MSIKIIIQFGWRWGRASSFYFVRYEQNEMCLNVRWLFFQLTNNVLALGVVAENRRRKFRFRRNVAKANSYLLIYTKKPIKLAFADFEAQTFN